MITKDKHESQGTIKSARRIFHLPRMVIIARQRTYNDPFFSGFLQGENPDQDQQVDPEEREEEHGQRGEPHAHDPHDQDPEQHRH